MSKKDLEKRVKHLEKIVGEGFHNLHEVVKGIEAELATEDDGSIGPTESPLGTKFTTSSPAIVMLDEAIPVSADQAKSMSDGGGWLIGYDRSNGWLFIGNLGSPPSEEGNGCWHDVKGDEQHGSVG
jgi:hypothetical protein